MSRFKRMSAFFMLMFIIMQMFGCAVYLPEPQEVSSEDEALAMGFSAGDYNGKLRVGEYEWLPVNLKIDYQYALRWSSADPEIATVDSNGRVDAISPGTTTITASAKKATVEYEITVTKAAKKKQPLSTAIAVDESEIQQNVSGIDVLANPYAILINVRNGCATVYTYNNSGVYSRPVRAMVCSVGEKESSVLGSYSISDKQRWHSAEDGNHYQYYCGIEGDANLFLASAPYKSESASDLITAEYNKLGTACTGGEIRFSADDAKWIYDNCVEGTFVKIISSDNKAQEPLGVPNPIKIAEASKHQTWDPTDHDENNPYKNEFPDFEGTEDTYVEVNGTFDAYDGVAVYDTCKNKHTEDIKVEGKVICTRKGMYVITYTYTDTLGRTGRADRKVYVVSAEEFSEMESTAQKTTE